MGRKRQPNLEVEYALKREVEDLKQEIARLKKIVRKFEKEDKAERKSQEVTVKKVKEPTKHDCPNCGAILKSSELPFGTLVICETGCGFREVKRR